MEVKLEQSHSRTKAFHNLLIPLEKPALERMVVCMLVSSCIIVVCLIVY